MKERRHRRLSLRRPITLFVVILVLTITLGVLWHVRLVHDYQKMKALAAQDVFHWTFIAMGSVLFLAIIVLSSILGGELIGHIRWSRRQSNFIASVSHELNSPLSAIKLFAQTLRNPNLAAEDRQSFVEKILFDVDRLQHLIANILRAAEIDTLGDELPVVTQRVELIEYLEHYIHDIEVRHARHELRVSLDGPPPPLHFEIDRLMFRQVLDNLIDNAIRYRGDTSPRVVLGLEPAAPGWFDLTVTDHGLGVDEEHLPKLFDRFFRSMRTSRTRQRPGTGIGLFIVRSIILAHGGKVWASSPGMGQGTTIHIRLPEPLGPAVPATHPQSTAVPATAVPATAAPATAVPATVPPTAVPQATE